MNTKIYFEIASCSPFCETRHGTLKAYIRKANYDSIQFSRYSCANGISLMKEILALCEPNDKNIKIKIRRKNEMISLTATYLGENGWP